MAENLDFGSDVELEFGSDTESVWSDGNLNDAFAHADNDADITESQADEFVSVDTDTGEYDAEATSVNPLDFITFGEKITVDTAPRFGLTGTAYFFSFKDQDRMHDANQVARAAFDHVLEEAFSESDDSNLIGVSINHPSLELEILVHFGKQHQTTSEKVMDYTIKSVQQSKKDLNFDDTMVVKVTRIVPPEGRGYRQLAKGRFEDFFKKHSGGHGSTFIQIKNNDWLCFGRAVVVAQARYQFYVLGDKSVPFDTIARGDSNKCTKHWHWI